MRPRCVATQSLTFAIASLRASKTLLRRRRGPLGFQVGVDIGHTGFPVAAEFHAGEPAVLQPCLHGPPVEAEELGQFLRSEQPEVFRGVLHRHV